MNDDIDIKSNIMMEQTTELISSMLHNTSTIAAIIASICGFLLVLKIMDVEPLELLASISISAFKKVKKIFFPKAEDKTLEDIQKIILICENGDSKDKNDYCDFLNILLTRYKEYPQHFKPILLKYEPTFSLILANLKDAEKKNVDTLKVNQQIKKLLQFVNEDTESMVLLIQSQENLVKEMETQVLINSLNEEKEMLEDFKKLNSKEIREINVNDL